MAYFASASDYFSTTTGLLSLTTTNRTTMAWVRNRSAIPAGQYNVTYEAAGQFPSVDSLGGLYTSDAEEPEQTQVRPGGFFVDVFATAVTPGEWRHVAWVKIGTTQRFYVNGTQVGSSYTFDLGGLPTPATTTIELIGTDGYPTLTPGDMDVLYHRSWDAALSGSEVLAEAISQTVVTTAGLWRDTPLTADGLDISGNSRHWTTNGTITYPAASPFPDNSGALTAQELSPPETVVQELDTSSGIVLPVWFTFTATADQMFGVFAYGDASVYTPVVQVYLGPASAPTLYFDPTSDFDPFNKPIQFTVHEGVEYFLKVIPANDFDVPATLVLKVKYGPTLDVPAGALFITNDQSVPVPGVFISASDGTVINAIVDFAESDNGDIQPTGEMLFEDTAPVPNQANHYHPNFTANISGLYTFSTINPVRTNNQTGNFWSIFKSGSTNVVKQVSAAGAILNSYTITPTSTVPSALATNNAESIVYFVHNATNSPIQRRTIPALADPGDLISGFASEAVSDILVMPDDSLIVLYSTTTTTTVRRITSAGAVTYTVTFSPTVLAHGSTRPRLAYSNNDSDTTFWLWTHQDVGLSVFTHLNVSDGSVIITLPPIVEFHSGVYQGDATPTPPNVFGPEDSCPLIVLREANAFAGTGGGGDVIGGTGLQVFPIRRVRITPTLSSENKRMYHRELVLDVQAGVGADGAISGQGYDPVVMMRYSDDSGYTWSDEQRGTLGKIGRYGWQIFWFRLGVSRNRVYEFVCSDPVNFTLGNAYVIVETGTGVR